MQKMKLTTIAISLLIAFSVHGQDAMNNKILSVKISNIQSKGKTLYVGIYRPNDKFPEFNKTWKSTKVIAPVSEMSVEFEVPYGEYAVAISHDLNGNGKLDTNIFGYPKEPFGFSNNFKPRLSSPNFSDCKFTFSQQTNSITIKLID
jgi:uncharacterized protein (DUF2141 family)